jgi:hypothetical protein
MSFLILVFRCMEAFGSKMGRKYCDFEFRYNILIILFVIMHNYKNIPNFRDYKECVNKDKQRMRYYAIRTERWKQWLRGERETPYEDHVKIGDYRKFLSSLDSFFYTAIKRIFKSRTTSRSTEPPMLGRERMRQQLQQVQS